MAVICKQLNNHIEKRDESIRNLDSHLSEDRRRADFVTKLTDGFLNGRGAIFSPVLGIRFIHDEVRRYIHCFPPQTIKPSIAHSRAELVQLHGRIVYNDAPVWLVPR